MVTVKVEKKKVSRAGAVGLGSSCPGKEQAAKGPVLGESLQQGSAGYLGLFLECGLRQRESLDFPVNGAIKHVSS